MGRVRPRRTGHTRPIGTTKRVRMFEMPFEPELGMLCHDGPWELARGYEIVGIEEVGGPGRWNLVLERISWHRILEAADDEVAFSIVPR